MTRPVSDNLRHELRNTILQTRRIADPAIGVVDLADAIVAGILPVIQSVDDNAHARGRAEADAERPPWIEAVLANRNDHGPACVALASLLADDEEVPPALRVIATRFLETRYIAGRPRARAGDPATSQAGADEAHDRITRPGGYAHRVLAAFRDVADQSNRVSAGNYPHGATAREVAFLTNYRTAHKRVSELLADGLVQVVKVSTLTDEETTEERDLVRKGGRVLAITRAGREEVARLDAALRVKREREAARRERRHAREQRRAERRATSA